MRTTNRLIATATALVAIGAVLAGCTSPVAPAVGFSAEKLTISVPTMVVGTAVTVPLPEAMGGEQGLVYSLSGTVPGLTFDAATRVLSGTPTTPGTYDMTYTAKDSATGGTMESVTFTIAVDAKPLTAEERIRGTWQQMEEWHHDGERVGDWVDYLTFTKTRFILVRSHFDMEGSLEESWRHEGTWKIADRDVVRIWYHEHDDDDETADVLTELRKPYLLVGDDDLIINHWADESGEDGGSDRMTRVSDLSLSQPPLGSWVRESHDDEGDWFEIATMTLESDGTFKWSTEDPNGTWELVAQWELDLDNYFVNLTNPTATWTGIGEEPEPDEESIVHTARFLRFAYAPMHSASGERMIRVSTLWDELDEPEGEYGHYWREFTLQR